MIVLVLLLILGATVFVIPSMFLINAVLVMIQMVKMLLVQVVLMILQITQTKAVQVSIMVTNVSLV